MGTALLVLAAALFIAAVVVFVTAVRRPKEPSRRGGRQDPLAFTDAMPQFGPRQLGPGAIVSYGTTDSLTTMAWGCVFQTIVLPPRHPICLRSSTPHPNLVDFIQHLFSARIPAHHNRD